MIASHGLKRSFFDLKPSYFKDLTFLNFAQIMTLIKGDPMKLKTLALGLGLVFALTACASHAHAQDVDLQLIRNATVKITFDDTTFLVDPILADAGSYDAFPNTYRSYLRNPLTPLPESIDEILEGVDAVLLTHTHQDHWDAKAQEVLPKDIPLLVQNQIDYDLVTSQGFKNVRILDKHDKFAQVTLTRTPCRHGSEKMMQDPDMKALLGEVMGIVFRAEGAPSIYLAADTVYFDGVEKTLKEEKPDYVVLNTGGASVTQAQFAEDPEIIMDEKDVGKVHQQVPEAKIIAVHMDAINHMTVDRKDLSYYVNKNNLRDKVFIPFDGEKLELK